MILIHPIPVCAKSCKPNNVQLTTIVRQKRNASPGTASSVTFVQKTAIARLQNGAAIMDTVS